MGLLEGHVLATAPSALGWQSGEISSRRLLALSSAHEEVTIQSLIDSLPAEIAVVDRAWNLLWINRAWEQAAERSGCGTLLPGGNYYTFCASNSDQAGARHNTLLDALDDVAADRRSRFWHAYTAPGETKAAYRVCISKLDYGTSAHATITRYETTELVKLRHQCQALGGSVLHIQDDERRRIGRELHDSTAQLLVALQLDFMRLRQGNTDPANVETLEDISSTIAQIHTEIRATAYLFHPPTNSEQSLAEAIAELVAGFGKRTGLDTRLSCNISERIVLPASRTALFRIAQEALANVHRHAEATAVEVRFNKRGNHIHLVIRDNGVGVPEYYCRPNASRTALGVGIAGMEERLAQLGGRLAFRRVNSGTCLTASLAIDPA